MRNQFEAQRKGENFPVAGWLLPESGREAVLIFYDYVRGMDEIADDPAYAAVQRESALLALDQTPPEWTQRYQAACAAGKINPLYGEQMLKAFLQDTRKNRYANWQELINYCEHSAVPVGHFMLDVFGEKDADLEASNALCHLLQILNHLQDMKQDALALDRIYLPQDQMQQHGVSEAMLTQETMPPQLRALTDALLDQCEPLLFTAQRLPGSLTGRRFRWQVRWILRIAAKLTLQLRRQDPLAQRVALSKWHYAKALVA